MSTCSHIHSIFNERIFFWFSSPKVHYYNLFFNFYFLLFFIKNVICCQSIWYFVSGYFLWGLILNGTENPLWVTPLADENCFVPKMFLFIFFENNFFFWGVDQTKLNSHWQSRAWYGICCIALCTKRPEFHLILGFFPIPTWYDVLHLTYKFLFSLLFSCTSLMSQKTLLGSLLVSSIVPICWLERQWVFPLSQDEQNLFYDFLKLGQNSIHNLFLKSIEFIQKVIHRSPVIQ